MTDTTPPASFEVPLQEISTIATAVAEAPETPEQVKPVAEVIATAASDVAAGDGVSSILVSGIRTVVPFGVAWGISEIASLGITIPASLELPIEGGAVFVIGSAYYLIVPNLEKRWPKLGWLLGSPKAPVYGS